MVKQRPTRRQLEVLRAYIRAGSVAAAAYELGISETTVRQHLSGLYRRTGCLNAAQAAYWLGTGGLASNQAPSRAQSADCSPRRDLPWNQFPAEFVLSVVTEDIRGVGQLDQCCAVCEAVEDVGERVREQHPVDVDHRGGLARRRTQPELVDSEVEIVEAEVRIEVEGAGDLLLEHRLESVPGGLHLGPDFHDPVATPPDIGA